MEKDETKLNKTITESSSMQANQKTDNKRNIILKNIVLIYRSHQHILETLLKVASS